MTPNPPQGARDLTGEWQLRNAAGAISTIMDLPGDVITGLERAGVIPDPYAGRNEYDLRWIADDTWHLERRFDLDETDVSLVLSGLDTVATVTLNDVVILDAQNAFRSYRVDVSAHARVKNNLLRITLHSNVKAAADRQDAHPYVVPYAKDNSPIPHGNMLRKPQCDFGWDWNIALAPCGVYGALRLEPNASALISDIRTRQVHENGAVRLEVTAQLHNTTEAQIRFAGQTMEVHADAHGAIHGTFEVAQPKLWWPAGMGAQTLYDLNVMTEGHDVTRKIGLRTIELDARTDEIGRAFTLVVNGQRMFMRGANWIPADALPGRITPEKTRDLLTSARDANMNMLRVWGGGRYESTDFYDTCDALGLLVWQDAMFACNLYPCDPEFLAEVDAEVRAQVARISEHACLALWCGDNELVGALTWFEESRADRDRYLVAYDRLNRVVQEAVRDTAPEANWWPSSPSRGALDFGDAWHDDRSGDMHFWSVWHEGRDFDHYRDVAPRFCSEFGFQSYPSMDVIRSFATPEDWNIAAPVLESHQKNAGGNARIAETMFRGFRFPAGFENFVYLSQVQQGLAIKTAVTHWRSLKPRCMGTLYWQLNDTWPVASWSSLDYGGGWKLLHHMARRFYAPVLLSVVPDGNTLALRLSNDTPADVTVQIEASALRLDGTTRSLWSGDHTCPTDEAVTAHTLDTSVLGEDEMLLTKLTLPDGAEMLDHFAPRPYKTYDLPDPDLTHSETRRGEAIQLTLRAKRPAFFAAIEPNQPGRLSDNAVLVLPDEPTTIEFTPAQDGPPPTFLLRDLHAATYAQH